MESNDIISAPCVSDVSALYEKYRRLYPGSRNDFYIFMTTPGTERDSFISMQDFGIDFKGSVAVKTVKSDESE
ncbi:MAG: hypothetical protein K2L89_06025 [Muribaculaceae bacterium]|nr:hypothetical protein [Muribaculaceae bacterium]